MKVKILILVFLGICFSVEGQVSSDSIPRQISKEIPHELLTQTIKHAGRVAASPIKFKFKDWAYTGAAAGIITLSFTQDDFLHAKLWGREGSSLNGLATYVGEPFGNPLYTASSALGIYLIGKSFKKDNLSEPALLAFQSIAISGASAMFFKLLFHRQRPYEANSADSQVWFGPSLKSNNLSFPSGHTTTAFALASSLATYYKDKWEVGIILYSLAGITAWSRIHDNQHWFSDVVAGALLGYFIGHTVASPDLYRWSVMPNSAGGMSLGFNYSF